MTQEQIKRCLHQLRYEGKWSLRAIAKSCGVAPSTITAAMTTQVSEPKQRRLAQFLPLIPRYAPRATVVSKRKPGHLKRYLIRYYNLKGWLAEIEKEPGIEKAFKNTPQRNMSRDKAAYVCARLDYQMKYHLLSLFGETLRQRKIAMGDPYPAEKWIARIHAALPGARPALFKKIMQRGTLER